MDPHTPSPGTPQRPSHRLSFSSLKSWWSQSWMSALFSTQPAVSSAASSPDHSPPTQVSTAASDAVDEGSAPHTPAPADDKARNNVSHHTGSSPLPSVPAVSLPSLMPHDKKEMSGGHQTVHAAGYKSTATSLAGPATTDVEVNRIPSVSMTKGGNSSVNLPADSVVVAESSASTTPQPSPSVASTPRFLSPSMAPLSEEMYMAKPWMLMGGISAAPSTNTGGTTVSSLPASTSTADVLAAEQMRTLPACVELPGPQSLFVRGTTSSGCDSRSMNLLQKSVLAEHLSASASHAQ